MFKVCHILLERFVSSGPWAVLYAAISACFDDVPPGYQVPRGKGMAMTSIQFRLKRLCSG